MCAYAHFPSSAYLYTHHPGQSRYLEVRAFLPLRTGQELRVEDRVELTYLTDDSDDTGDAFSCSHSSNFAFDDCILAQGGREMCRRLGCASPYLPKVDECPDCQVNLFNATYVAFLKFLHNEAD